MNNKMLARTLLILSSLAVVLEGCYLFCLFRPENAFEEMIEQFVEEELGASDEYSALIDETDQESKKEF